MKDRIGISSVSSMTCDIPLDVSEIVERKMSFEVRCGGNVIVDLAGLAG